jgi:hypothetical protein
VEQLAAKRSRPLRRIPLSRRSHIIGFQPLPTGITQHESALERDFVTITSFLDPTASITSQPVTIAFVDRDVRRRYTPDFLVTPTAHGALAELIEVKYSADLEANRAILEPGFEAARAWARERNTGFRVVTEREIRGMLLQNAKRLMPLRTAAIDTQLAELVLRAARSLEAPTFGKLLATLPQCPSLALATIWRLIARGDLRVDLSTDITFDSPVSAT